MNPGKGVRADRVGPDGVVLVAVASIFANNQGIASRHEGNVIRVGNLVDVAGIAGKFAVLRIGGRLAIDQTHHVFRHIL